MLVFVLTLVVVGAEDQINVSVGGTVELRGAGPAVLGAGFGDVRWSWTMSRTGLVTRKNPVGCRGRCALLDDGALRLDDARTSDSGVYRQEVYNEGGVRLSKNEIELTVYGQVQVWARGWTPVGLCVILLILLIAIFIRTKRATSAANQSRETDSRGLDENVYVPMFRATDPKTQNQTKTTTKPGAPSVTQSPSDPCDPEEDIYV
ncbi:hypothetical protein NQD34_010096 [Periophthalmus magnuspinnatus]|nr:hypothetical protein NQD34_010096 [Periophthalmus magnuspinnatus]